MEEPKIAKKDTLAREFRRVEITRAIKLKTDAEIASFSFGFDLGESSNLDSGSKQEGNGAKKKKKKKKKKSNGVVTQTEGEIEDITCEGQEGEEEADKEDANTKIATTQGVSDKSVSDLQDVQTAFTSLEVADNKQTETNTKKKKKKKKKKKAAPGNESDDSYEIPPPPPAPVTSTNTSNSGKVFTFLSRDRARGLNLVRSTQPKIRDAAWLSILDQGGSTECIKYKLRRKKKASRAQEVKDDGIVKQKKEKKEKKEKEKDGKEKAGEDTFSFSFL